MLQEVVGLAEVQNEGLALGQVGKGRLALLKEEMEVLSKVRLVDGGTTERHGLQSIPVRAVC